MSFLGKEIYLKGKNLNVFFCEINKVMCKYLRLNLTWFFEKSENCDGKLDLVTGNTGESNTSCLYKYFRSAGASHLDQNCFDKKWRENLKEILSLCIILNLKLISIRSQN